MKEIPLRAVGGNVLLRKVAADVHRSGLTVYGGKSTTVLQLGEVIGLGGRWTQDRKWFPPMPTPKRTTLDNGKWDPDWKPPDLTYRARPQPPRFCKGHEDWLSELKVSDLVVYIQSRVYDVFPWEGDDILVYPGNWILGVVSDMTITDEDLRRYEKDEFDDAPYTKNLRAPAAKATGQSIREFFERRR